MTTDIDQIFDDIAQATGVFEPPRHHKFLVNEYVIVTEGEYKGRIGRVTVSETQMVFFYDSRITRAFPFDWLRPMPTVGEIVEIRYDEGRIEAEAEPGAHTGIDLNGLVGQVLELLESTRSGITLKVRLSVGTYHFDPRYVHPYRFER